MSAAAAAPPAPDPRAALLSVAPPAADGEAELLVMDALGLAIRDMGLAALELRSANDPGALPGLAVDLLVAAEGVCAAADAAKRHFAGLHAAAAAEAEAVRSALAALMAGGGAKRVEGRTHRATLTEGRAKAVVFDPGALPDIFTRTKLEHDLGAIRDAHSKGQDVPGARMERSPVGVALKPLPATQTRSTAR